MDRAIDLLIAAMPSIILAIYGYIDYRIETKRREKITTEIARRQYEEYKKANIQTNTKERKQ